MVARKKPAAKRKAKVSSVSKKKGATHEVLVCSSCHSPHATVLMIDGVPRYVCQRCGHVSKLQVAQSKEEAKRLVRQRRSHVVASHRLQQGRRHDALTRFVNNYHLRVWFKVISTFLLCLGLVLLPTVEFVNGILFVLIGVLGLYAGLKWL